MSPSQDVATHSTISHQINSSEFWPIKGGICHAFRHLGFQIKIMFLLSLFIYQDHGFDLENPYLHLREFEEVRNTYNDSNCSINTKRLKLFPFSLKDKAKTLLQNLRPGSIRAWDEMQQQFLKKSFPSYRTNSFKRQITTFT